MEKLFVRWLILAVSVVVASALTQALGLGFQADYSSLGSIARLLIGVAILAFLNATVGLFLKILTIPLSCLTLGLFSLVINAFILEVAASLHLGFAITKQGAPGFWAAFFASIFISLVSGALSSIIDKSRDADYDGRR